MYIIPLIMSSHHAAFSVSRILIIITAIKVHYHEFLRNLISVEGVNVEQNQKPNIAYIVQH